MFASILLSLVSIVSPIASDPAAPAAPVVTAGPPGATATAKLPSQRRYCLIETARSGYVMQKTCQTREEWRRQGLELPEK